MPAFIPFVTDHAEPIEAFRVAEGHARLVNYSATTTVTAVEDAMLVYQVSVGIDGDDGVYINGSGTTPVTNVVHGSYYVPKGKTIDLKGDFLIVGG